MQHTRFLPICLAAAAVAFAQDADRGTDLYRTGKYAEAETQFRGVLDKDAENATASRLLGLTLVEEGKLSDAEPYLKKANEKESNGETKAALARLYAEQKNYDAATEALNGSEGDQATYARGLIAYSRKDYQASAEAFESFLANNPNQGYGHYYAGMAYNGARRPDKMLSHFEMFLRLRPNAPEARKVQSVLRAVK